MIAVNVILNFGFRVLNWVEGIGNSSHRPTQMHADRCGLSCLRCGTKSPLRFLDLITSRSLHYFSILI